VVVLSAVVGFILFFVDASFLFASVYLVSLVSFLMPIGQFAIVIVSLISFYAFRLYDLPRIKRTQNLLSNALLAVVVSGVLGKNRDRLHFLGTRAVLPS